MFWVPQELGPPVSVEADDVGPQLDWGIPSALAFDPLDDDEVERFGRTRGPVDPASGGDRPPAIDVGRGPDGDGPSQAVGDEDGLDDSALAAGVADGRTPDRPSTGSTGLLPLHLALVAVGGLAVAAAAGLTFRGRRLP
ncbi:MAG: hypothetical protein AAFN30_16440 [Actinomycetota bacterium]